jgi:uncharacterized protein (TIGR02996 family)
MTDHDAFLAALEANPADDFAWLAYADWLEEQGDALAGVLRGGIESRVWLRWHWRYDLMRPFGRRRRQLLACDCVERVLPLFEGRYPDDLRPRQFIEAIRCESTSPQFVATRRALRHAYRAQNWNSAANEVARLAVANEVVQLITLIPYNPTHVCHGAPGATIFGLFGPDAHRALPSQSKPEWQAVRDAEIRWQIARLLRYRIELFAGTSASSSGR